MSVAKPKTGTLELRNPWRSLQLASAALGCLGVVLLLAAMMSSGPAIGMLAPGVVLTISMSGAWAFTRSRAALIEPNLEMLRRGEAVMQWELEPAQWTDFVRRRRLWIRAWMVGASAGVSLVPALLFAVLLAGPPDAQSAAAWIGGALGGLWALTLLGVAFAGRSSRTPQPILFAPKLCAVGSTVFAWPHGIAMIDLDEASQTLSITRKGASFMPALTFAIPVPQSSLDEARTLLPS